jgi:carboxylesterase
MLVKNTEPFYYPGNDTGCLLIHGFTGAPTEMHPLGEYLAGFGYTVLGIRLAGHGTKIEDMNRMHWQDWSASVLDGWHLLQSTTKNIFLIGLSMGGALALYHSSFLPVTGVVGLSAPYEIRSDPRRILLPYISWLVPYIEKGDSDWQDPHAIEDHFSYDLYPTKAILQLSDLLKALRAALPKVSAPALLIHSKKDIGVPLENQDLIYNTLGTPEHLKKKIVLENSGHVITRDQEKDTVFQSVQSFIAETLTTNS